MMKFVVSMLFLILFSGLARADGATPTGIPYFDHKANMFVNQLWIMGKNDVVIIDKSDRGSPKQCAKEFDETILPGIVETSNVWDETWFWQGFHTDDRIFSVTDRGWGDNPFNVTYFVCRKGISWVVGISKPEVELWKKYILGEVNFEPIKVKEIK